ncbi:membrane protein DedA, SNARE-associated domain [Cohaesibacter sp. ES.047]|uniref:DedA family protein n=1 Tax=Cohaesibacter sp. ES.047 TaxID=1798205 RepID=UPI000BB6DD9B|nr:DedA family protein [Cohaesibacter sp. ES.047]SNY91944.1 membrane protein DedA, SNARE-associated domain [Cohaesibacter sp. ES.047]
MTEAILALIPTFGLWVLFFTVLLSCHAIPVPASMLVLSSGAFAASDDLELYQALLVAFCAVVLGDQSAYCLARLAGSPLITRLRTSSKIDGMIDRAEDMFKRRGMLAVFLSRTIFSPVGPWMSVLCGSMKVKWQHFAIASILGSATWVTVYVMMGYVFADRLTELAELASQGIGFIAAFGVAIAAGWWLRQSWKRYRDTQERGEETEATGDTSDAVLQTNVDTI